MVTVWLSLTLLCTFAVFFSLVESARTAGSRWYLQTAADSAIDSVFSQYNRELWDSYRLLFAGYESGEALAADFEQFLAPYLEADNWYPMAFMSAGVSETVCATDNAGDCFEEEILDYMKYGVWDLDFGEDEADGLLESIAEAAAVTEVARTYRTESRQVLRLEKALEKISENLSDQREKKADGLSELDNCDGPGFRRQAAALIRLMEKIPALVEDYKEKADALAQELKQSRAEFEEKNEEIGSGATALLESEIAEYEAYVSVDGERRQEVTALTDTAQRQIAEIEDLIEAAIEVEEEIAEWDGDEDEEEPDPETLWRPVRRRFARIGISALSFSHGIEDEEKKGWLEAVETIAGEGFLGFIVPEDREISEKSLALTGAPSALSAAQGDRDTSISAHLLVDEYCGKFFSDFVQNRESGVLVYEIEYLLSGNDTDRENLSSAAAKLLAAREGLNLVHILSDSSKREQARGLAMVITGAASVTPLILVTTFFVMSVWAMGESLMDLKGMLAGRKVPLFKSADDWSLDLDGLLSIGSGGEGGDGGGESGLSYLSWLKIFLFAGDAVVQEYRMMDIIEANLKQTQPDFRMQNALFKAKLTGNITAKHLFFSPGFMEALLGETDHAYRMSVSAERTY